VKLCPDGNVEGSKAEAEEQSEQINGNPWDEVLRHDR
jgi:hypothetical protein